MAFSLVGCGATLPKIKPYKMDIQQGNVVTSEMLLKLRPGMTKSQVKFIMGTPLLVDSFRTNRWDYFYQLRKQGKIVNQRRVILDFENDLLKRVRGDVVAKGKTVEDVTQELEQEAEEAQASEVLKDEMAEPPVAEVQPMEAPAIEATENLPESTEAEAVLESEETTPASAVEAAASTAAAVEPDPTVDVVSPEAEQTLKETSKQIEAVKEEAKEVVEEVAPAVVEQPEVPAAAKPEVKAVPVSPKELPVADSVPVVEPDPVAEPSKEILTVLPSKVDDKLVFRVDRSLDMKRIVPQEVSTSKAPLQESVVQEVKEVEESLPAEEPSFFERMLEKIGF